MKVCIFDLDGTLTNTLESLLYSTNETLKELGMPLITMDQCRNFVGNGAAHQIRCALKAAGDDNLEKFEKAMEVYLRIFAVHCVDRVVPYEGIVEMLKALKEDGVKIAVNSNKPHEQTVNVTETVFGKGFFDRIQGQEEGMERKPDAAGTYRILEALGASKEECTYIGDTEVDVKTAENAGVKMIGASWGFRGRDILIASGAKIVIDRPEELLHYVL